VRVQVVDEDPGRKSDRNVAGRAATELEEDQRGVSQVELDPPALASPVLVLGRVGELVRRLPNASASQRAAAAGLE
jgi:hypothetical protein